jgi:predicted metal-dependent phosphoesterase TrpH
MKVDFHIHTKYSYDSLMEPDKIIRNAVKKGLDGIVICDHNTIRGGVEVDRHNTNLGLKIIVGAEIYTSVGDITGIFLHKEIVSRDFDDVIDEIRAQGGKVILNHPFKQHDLSKIDFSKIDYIEGYNGRLSIEYNQKAIELANQYKIPIISGSDAHLYNEIGNCFTLVNDLTSLMPIHQNYKQTKFLNITLSQYIKAYKRRDIKVFISASKILIKRIFKKYL